MVLCCKADARSFPACPSCLSQKCAVACLALCCKLIKSQMHACANCWPGERQLLSTPTRRPPPLPSVAAFPWRCGVHAIIAPRFVWKQPARLQSSGSTVQHSDGPPTHSASQRVVTSSAGVCRPDGADPRQLGQPQAGRAAAADATAAARHPIGHLPMRQVHTPGPGLRLTTFLPRLAFLILQLCPQQNKWPHGGGLRPPTQPRSQRPPCSRSPATCCFAAWPS